MIAAFVVFLIGVTGVLFARRGQTNVEFLCLFFVFISSALFAQSIFISLNLILKISNSAILTSEIFISLVAFIFLQLQSQSKPKNFPAELKREAGMTIVLIIYGLFCLTKVHLNYVGMASTVLNPEFYAHGLNYPYPFFSDEWHAISLSQKSLSNGLMPFYYPYSQETVGFLNVQWLFHNFNTGIFQFFSIDPLTSYVGLGIAINIFTVVLCYLIMRFLEVTRISAFICAALIFHLTHGSNFPSVWSYLPIHLGILSFLTGVLGLLAEIRLSIFFFWGLTCLIYPPLIICILPFVFYARGKKLILMAGTTSVSVVLVFVLVLASNLLTTTNSLSPLSYIGSRFIFTKPSPEIHDSLNLYFIVSLVALVLSLFGLSRVKKQVPILLYTTLMTFVFWVFYSQTSWRLIIDYPRVVLISCLCIHLIAGFGLDQIVKFHSGLRSLVVAIFIGYLSWYGLQYTELNRWESLTVQLTDGTRRLLKARPPANTILTNDDLRIANNLKGEFFISEPWKSTVLATAVQIRPIFLKSGTITDLSTIRYDDFKSDVCSYLKGNWRIRFYLYLHESIPVNCEGLVLQDRSSENFNLYFHSGVPL